VQSYLDMLPGWLSGFGVQANYTYVDSKTKLYTPVTSAYCSGASNAANLNLNLNGCDTDGRSFGDLPLPQLSKNTFNLALLFDQGSVVGAPGLQLALQVPAGGQRQRHQRRRRHRQQSGQPGLRPDQCGLGAADLG
jgi:hypothetical protein